MKITRSFTRKINLGNYETADFYCEYESETDDLDTAMDLSKLLHGYAKGDVEKSIAEFLKKREAETFTNEERVLIENARNGLSSDIEVYQTLTGKNPRLIGAINDAKKEWKRSDEYKSTLKSRKDNN